MRSLLPADTYKVFNKAFITDKEKDILVNLYQPIIGVSAVSLYLTLYLDLGKNDIESEELPHHHLMNLMMLNILGLVEARERLEAVGLLKTFYKEDNINNYIYVLYAPISANEFLNHPILNVVLNNNVGKNEYEKLVEKYRTKKLNTKNFVDITKNFDDIFTTGNGYSLENLDVLEEKTRRVAIKSNIDLNLIISGIPRRMTSDRCFNNDTLELITDLAYLYKIDNLNMQGLVRNSINERGMIDSNLLKTSCRDFYQFENNGKLPTLIYNKQPDYLKEPVGDNSELGKVIYTFENVSPYAFLKSSYNNTEPTSRDKKIIESLMIDQKLNPGVINVLIDYVLRTNNKKLNKEYIETIAGQWKRLNIETVKEAMEICKKEHRKVTKMVKKEQKNEINNNTNNLPEWFDSNLSSNKENIEELDEILKEFD